MSGDVQPRKRKDRRRKRDQNDKADGEVSFSRKPSIQEDDESSHGVHITKMGNDDVHLHVQHDHGTGGHWCAKIFFFSLLVVLVGLVGLIILENRGLSDLDTPLSESRFSNYFDGWVEEHRDEHGHDEHDDIQASIEEHDEHDEPFEEEEDHSEDDVDHEEDHDEDDEDEEEEEDQQTAEDDEDADHDDDDEDGDDNQTAEDDEDEEVDSQAAQTVEEDDDDDDNDNDNDDDNDNDNDNDDDNENDDDNDDADQTVEEDEADSQGGQTVEEDDQDDDQDDNDEADNDNNTQEDNEDDDQTDDNDEDDDQEATQEQTAEASQQDDDPFDEDEDDGTFESLEKVVENDAEELLLLQEKARQQAAENGNDKDDADDNDSGDDEAAPSWASSLAVKIGVGVALALVARHVLIRKNPNTKYSEEEIEIEEEFEEEIIEEYVDSSDHEEQPVEEELEPRIEESRYVPETFEQFNAMYRPQVAATPNKKEENPREAPAPSVKMQPATPLQAPNEPNEPSSSSSHVKSFKDDEEPAVKGGADGEYIDEADGDDADYMVYHGDGDDVEISDEDEDDLDDLDIDDGDDDDEEYDDHDHEDGDEDLLDDISDVDDSDLMNRLEAKYGRLPAKEFESDEDAEDPSWIQIKVKDTIGGGPQSMEDEFNSLERELRNANEEMMREASTRAFDELQRKYPDRPQVFLAKARALDRLAAERKSNKLLSLALEEFKRYLAFGELLQNATEFRQTAEHCIERMRFIGYMVQAVPIHMSLIERFPDEPRLRNQFAVTFLLMNDLLQAKQVLKETLELWPSDGFAQVHYGFVLQQLDKEYEKAAIFLHKGIYSNAPGTQDGLFYFKLGEALQRLGRQPEAVVVFQRGADLKLFPSAYQRSLYNEPKLRAKPFWTPDETYGPEFAALASNWQLIRREGVSLLNERGGFEPEAENLLAAGDWKQLELFADGRELPSCRRAPLTCRMLRQFKEAAGCRAGQIKFSVMHPGSHVWPHCGPTNRRLRAHLGLVVPPGTYLRVAEEVRTWTEGEFLIFDDSFEHEVWHYGSSLRLILIVDIWHPDLSAEQRRTVQPFARTRTFG